LKTTKDSKQTAAQETVTKQQNGDLHADISQMIPKDEHEKQ
jgi:hypothetical protein